MRLSKIVTLLLAGFFTFGTLNSVAATKHAKTAIVAKQASKASKASKSASQKVAPKSKKMEQKKIEAKGKTSKKAVKSAQKLAKNKTAKKSTVSLAQKHKNTPRQHFQSGVASYYADKFNGRRTANGERFDNGAMTAAHRSLPFGTLIEVTNMRNGKKVVVRVNDRGPYNHARVLDLSKNAARQLGMHNTGIAQVKVAVLDKSKRTDLDKS
nr:septal ring lytic transglycosylase RlpA family protein [uncultured Haemophilus sp.]